MEAKEREARTEASKVAESGVVHSREGEAMIERLAGETQVEDQRRVRLQWRDRTIRQVWRTTRDVRLSWRSKGKACAENQSEG